MRVPCSARNQCDKKENINICLSSIIIIIIIIIQ